MIEGRRLFSWMVKETAEILEKDPVEVTGYLKRSQDLKAKLKRLFMRLEASEEKLNKWATPFF